MQARTAPADRLLPDRGNPDRVQLLRPRQPSLHHLPAHPPPETYYLRIDGADTDSSTATLSINAALGLGQATNASKADADAAWQAAEANARAGLRHDPGRGRQRFGHYVEATWLPNHRMELSTRADYTSAIYRHILWFFGPMKMRDIGPAQVREWITALTARGVSARRIEYSKNPVLAAVFTAALEVCASGGITAVTTPPRAPRANCDAGRWARAVRAGRTGRMLAYGQAHLRAVSRACAGLNNVHCSDAPAPVSRWSGRRAA